MLSRRRIIIAMAALTAASPRSFPCRTSGGFVPEASG